MAFIYKILIAISAALVGIGAPLVVKKVAKKELKDDNLVEEMAEKVIKETTGVDVDLTPDSKEEDDAIGGV